MFCYDLIISGYFHILVRGCIICWYFFHSDILPVGYSYRLTVQYRWHPFGPIFSKHNTPGQAFSFSLLALLKIYFISKSLVI